MATKEFLHTFLVRAHPPESNKAWDYHVGLHRYVVDVDGQIHLVGGEQVMTPEAAAERGFTLDVILQGISQTALVERDAAIRRLAAATAEITTLREQLTKAQFDLAVAQNTIEEAGKREDMHKETHGQLHAENADLRGRLGEQMLAAGRRGEQP